MTNYYNRWWDKSLNLVTGCTPVGAGCDHCWAEGMVRRFGHLHGGRIGLPTSTPTWGTIICHEDRLAIPRKRRKPTIYAVSLLGDLFHEEVPREMQKSVVGLAADCPQHKFVWLTKRWRIAAEFCSDCEPPSNVIVLGSAWDHESASEAYSELEMMPHGIRRGLHLEPLLGPVDLTWQYARLPSWIVAGPENGPGHRPCNPAWLDSLQEQCQLARVPFWRKTRTGEGPHQYPW